MYPVLVVIGAFGAVIGGMLGVGIFEFDDPLAFSTGGHGWCGHTCGRHELPLPLGNSRSHLSDMGDVQGYIGKELGRFTDEILEFLRIPSVSAKSEHNTDTRRTAEWLRDRMEGAGLEAEVLETAGHPVVLGEWSGADTDALTVLGIRPLRRTAG